MNIRILSCAEQEFAGLNNIPDIGNGLLQLVRIRPSGLGHVGAAAAATAEFLADLAHRDHKVMNAFR